MQASPYGTSVKGFRDGSSPRIVRIDVLLLLAVVGLMGCSLYTIASATKDDIPGDPNFYVTRQATYAAVGLVFMLVLSRIDYSRLREWRMGLYGFMIIAILAVYAAGSVTRGSKRAIELGFFQLQTSELGKVLLVLTLSAFVVDRTRRLGERETTSRILLLALIPAMLVIAQPDLGSGLVYLSIALAVLFVAGTPWTHFAALGAIAVTAIVVVLVAAPSLGVEGLKPYQTDR